MCFSTKCVVKVTTVAALEMDRQKRKMALNGITTSSIWWQVGQIGSIMERSNYN